VAICDLGAYWRSRLGGRDFRVQAVAREPRAAAIPAAEEEVRRRRGDVLDSRMFGNLSLNLLVEMPGGEVGPLADALAARGWHVEVEPGREALAARAADRLEGTFQVTFPEGDGELAIPTPAVPG
jgi:hypothetical protein